MQHSFCADFRVESDLVMWNAVLLW